MIVKGLRDDQRQALKEISIHLKGVKKIIQGLGSDSFEGYCRCDHLSKKKIGELKGLEPDSDKRDRLIRLQELRYLISKCKAGPKAFDNSTDHITFSSDGESPSSSHYRGTRLCGKDY